MDHAKLLDILTSLPISHAILPCAMWFAMSRPANHAMCSFIDLCGYASGPIRRCLFIDYIIKEFIILGRVAQSVTCLTADACLTADPGVTSLIPAWSHTFAEIDHE